MHSFSETQGQSVGSEESIGATKIFRPFLKMFVAPFLPTRLICTQTFLNPSYLSRQLEARVERGGNRVRLIRFYHA